MCLTFTLSNLLKAEIYTVVKQTYCVPFSVPIGTNTCTCIRDIYMYMQCFQGKGGGNSLSMQ